MQSHDVRTADDLPANVLDAVKAGRRLEAIRLLREATGMGLANAKVLVDTAARHHGVPPVAPALVEVSTTPYGLLKVLLLALSAYGFYWYFTG